MMTIKMLTAAVAVLIASFVVLLIATSGPKPIDASGRPCAEQFGECPLN